MKWPSIQATVIQQQFYQHKGDIAAQLTTQHQHTRPPICVGTRRPLTVNNSHTQIFSFNKLPLDIELINIYWS